MVKLNYQTNNPRWGWSGVCYSSWENYAFALGFLSNICHYKNKYSCRTALIDVRFERNDLQDAWGKEGRIHYYGDYPFLKKYFLDWYRNRSAGVGNITCRINSNKYIYSLIYDYDFKVVKYDECTTCDIFPPDDIKKVVEIFEKHLPENVDVDNIISAFYRGFEL